MTPFIFYAKLLLLIRLRILSFKWPASGHLFYFMTENKEKIVSGFDNLGIKDTILEQIKKMGYVNPTPIQEKAIPVGLKGEDLIGVAQTGTGKTFAFGIPMIQQIGAQGGRGLVLLPTRELALQVEDSLKKVGGPLGLKTASFIGGEAMERQLYALRKNPHVIIATPGRLNDYLNRNILKLDNISVLVLDEADMMFDMGFAPQVEEILARIKSEHQTMLFSATMPASIVKLAAAHMKMPVSVEVAPPGTSAEKIDQEIYIMHKDDRAKHLLKILEDYKGSVLVFVRTKFGVKGLCDHLKKLGHSAEEIHSNLSLSQRRRSLGNFKAGKSRILVATDIAARGLDVSGIEIVVNYHLPDKLSDYVHRIGRTARAGKEGKAISFATADQARDIRDIENLISRQIPLNEFVELKRIGVGKSKGNNSRSRKPSRSPYSGGHIFDKKRPSSFNRSDKPFGKEDGGARSNDKPGAGFEKRPERSGHKFGSKRSPFVSREKKDSEPSYKKKASSDFNFIEDMPVARKKSVAYEEQRGFKPSRKPSDKPFGEKRSASKNGRSFSSPKRKGFQKF